MVAVLENTGIMVKWGLFNRLISKHAVPIRKFQLGNNTSSFDNTEQCEWTIKC